MWLPSLLARRSAPRTLASRPRRTLLLEALESRDLLTYEPFTVAIIPDTQFYSQSYPQTFHAQTQWIVDNRDNLNIDFVTHLGDIVENGEQGANRNLVEWQRADAAMDRLDGNLTLNPDGLVPYSAVIGNHDYAGGQHSGGGARYIEFFGAGRYQGRSWYGGTSPNGLNHYQIFTAGDWRFLHLGLQWEPTDADLVWAQSVLASNPTLPTMLSTHSYLNPNTRRRPTTLEGQDGNPGEQIFQKLVRLNPQVFMVLNGHFLGEFMQTSLNALGRPVFEMASDYQGRPNGGNGWMRTLEFRPAESRIQVRTYSPTLNQYETDADSQFSIPLDFYTRFGPPQLYAYTVANYQTGLVAGGAVYQGTVDTQLKQAMPNLSYGGSTAELLVDARSPAQNDESQALLRFDNLIGYGAGQVHPGAHILSAELIVNSTNAGHGAKLHRMLRSWQGTDTWNSLGNGIQANGVEAAIPYAAQVGLQGLSPLVGITAGLRLNVTGDVQAWARGQANHGWAMLAWDNGTDGWGFSPSETTGLASRPRLRVEWVPSWYPVNQFQQGVDHGGGLYTGAVDTYLEAAAPTSQHGADPILWMDGTQNNETRHGLLRFDNLFGTGPGQIPPDAYILSARLYLTTPYTQAQAAGGGASPHLPFQPWTDTATWANDFGGDGIQADDYDAFSYAEPNTGVVGLGTHGFDVTISVLFWEWGVPNYGLALLPNTNDGWAISSAEYEVAVERPRLVVVWWPFTGPGPGGSPGTIGSITDVSPLLGGEVDSLRQQVESYTPRGVAVGVRQEHPATREEVRAPSLLIEDTFADVPWAALARLSATRGQGKHGAAWTATHDLPFMIDPTQRAQAV